MASDYSRFEWREAEKGVWRREADEAELFYHSLSKHWAGTGRSFFHMTGHMVLQVPVQDEQSVDTVGEQLDAALQKAWVTLRYDHPCIAAQIKLDPVDGKYYKVYPVDSESWVEDTLKRELTPQSGAQWANNDPPAPSLPTLTVLSPSSTDNKLVRRDLVLRSPHDIIDGIGTLMLFDNYVRHASEAYAQGNAYTIPSLNDDAVIKNLSPPLRVAANVPPEPSDDIKARNASIDEKQKAGLWGNLEPLGVPCKTDVKIPGVHKRVEHGLSPEATKQLVEICKKHDVTPTMAFHAAIPTVVRDLVDRGSMNRSVRYISYLLRNERASCSPPYNGKAHPTGVYHSASSDKMAVDLEVPRQGTNVSDEDRQKEFKVALGTAREFYTSVRYDRHHKDLVPFIFARGICPLPSTADAKPPPIPDQAETAPVSISSMGVIDKVIENKRGDIEVHDPWVTGEELRNGLGLFLGTYRGSLTVSAAYNDAWHDEAEIQRFLRQVIDIVNLGLFGVKDYKQG